MKIFTKREIEKVLIKLGLKKGDTVLVHSDISRIGMIRGCKSKEEYLEILFNIFLKVIGKKGTLVVPAFFYEYGRWQTPYDTKRSPVSNQLGVFSQYVAGLPQAARSPNPIAALAAVGPKAKYICCGGAGSAYGTDSPWDNLMKCNAKMIFFGIDLSAMTFGHYVEHMVGVPHVYNKIFTAPVSEKGKKIKLLIHAQVRYLKFGIEYEAEDNTRKLEKGKVVKKVKIGEGVIRCLSCHQTFEFLKEKLKNNPYYFLKKKPKFTAGKIPMDGGSGKERK
ncbi:aminoglycoside N(3)-acetyltransferase [Candidatus Falkowbacteria bacterium CG11_big_fil_rev_8_21_14_0_20_39_10]|uniref:Aminoglycoside N(3)-acetyltransferase n=1 Tax=Candidatus Falkowbacteria bacterium CG11_big_fil_rev_8_21_14_0_20_39_10 TaxID=1974570 RepID=A0A2M6K9I7_9BACT|nr:MAG: aminoglycoside N(3)-acetyltransferase [Candidatus Falkowbacteria bacterium CG11_big_fil_rev_8_21_14_0_20_39_10]